MNRWVDSNLGRLTRGGVALVFIFVALLVPFSRLLLQASDRSGFFEVLFSGEVVSTALSTFGYSALALVLSVVLALIMGLQTHRTPAPWIRAVFETTWVLPGAFVALLVLGAQKWLGVVDRYGWHSIVVAWVLLGVPYITLGWLRAIDDLDDRELEAFQSLGADRRTLFFKLIFPKTWPMLQSLCVHQFYSYLVSFTLVAILGGGAPTETLEVGIYTAVHFERARMLHLIAMGLWQMLGIASVRILLNLISRKYPTVESQRVLGQSDEWNRHSHTLPRAPGMRWVLWAVGIFIFLMLIFNPDSFDAWIQGVGLASVTSALTLVLGLGVLALRLEKVALTLAWVSPMIFSVAWWKAYALPWGRFDGVEWVFAGLVVGVQSFLFLPWFVRFLEPLFRRSRRRELEAYQSLGGTRWKAWWAIEWPRLKTDTRFLVSMVWGFSFCEVSTAILFSKGGFEPMGVWVQNQLSRFRIHEAWVGTLLLIATSFWVVQSRKRVL